MAKLCGKCGGSGWWGARFDLYPNARGGPCRACDGSGYDQRWGTTSCKSCGTSIDYRFDWSRVPEYCQSCKQPRYTSCKGCGTSIEYKVYWNHIPEYCPSCKEWKEKSCKGCGTTIRYKSFWDNIPEICKDCKTMARRRGADEICRGTELERWLSGRRGERVQNMGDHFHVTLYVEGGHVSGNVDKYSTRTWEVHGRIRNYNPDGSQGSRGDDLYFDF